MTRRVFLKILGLTATVPMFGFPEKAKAEPIIWGQKSLESRPLALERVNVRECINKLSDVVAQVLESYQFEINDKITRARISSSISNMVEQHKVQGCITNYKVICDDTNNNMTSVENGNVNVDIFLQPSRTVEFIQLQYTIK